MADSAGGPPVPDLQNVTWDQVKRWTDDDCRGFLQSMRWPNGPMAQFAPGAARTGRTASTAGPGPKTSSPGCSSAAPANASSRPPWVQSSRTPAFPSASGLRPFTGCVIPRAASTPTNSTGCWISATSLPGSCAIGFERPCGTVPRVDHRNGGGARHLRWARNPPGPRDSALARRGPAAAGPASQSERRAFEDKTPGVPDDRGLAPGQDRGSPCCPDRHAETHNHPHKAPLLTHAHPHIGEHVEPSTP